MAKRSAREPIHLQCTESLQINYTYFKDKKKHPERIELNKYCPTLRKHTLHREIKK